MCDTDINVLDRFYLPSASLRRPSPNVTPVAKSHDEQLVEEQITCFLKHNKDKVTSSADDNDNIDNNDDSYKYDDDTSDI